MNSLKIFFTLLVCLLIVSQVQSQALVSVSDLDKKSGKNYNEAKNLARKGQDYKAIKKFDEVIKKHPGLVEARLRKASILYNQKRYEEAKEEFQEAIAIGPEFSPESYYSLAIVLQELKEYADAGLNFGFYLDRVPSNDPRRSRTEALMANALFASEAIANPVPFSPRIMSGAINSKNHEYTPIITIDGSNMIYTRRIRGQEDFYISQKTESGFEEGIALDALNTPGNEGSHSISADGTYLVFAACDRKDGYGGCDLYYSRKKDGQWTTPVNLGPVINTGAWESQPSITADGRTIYFTSNRRGGYGGSDLWKTFKDSNGKWVAPVNLGSTINSSGNEESPFIHADGVTLYIRSNGYPRMGDFDLFLSRYSEQDSTWSIPQNLGYPINTEGSEGALSVDPDGKTAYFTSDMAYLENPENANLDIYTFELPIDVRPTPVTFVKGKVTDAITGKPILAKLTMDLTRANRNLISIETGNNGYYLLTLPTGNQYSISAEKEGYLFHSEYFDLDSINSITDPYIIDIAMIPIPKETDTSAEISVVYNIPVILKNIFFETGSSQLKDISNAEIDKLVKLLNNSLSIKIKIIGHTDNVGSAEENQVLSEARAKAVYDALVKNGIAGNRLTYEGKGEVDPIAENETFEGRQQNRRTEFIIVR